MGQIIMQRASISLRVINLLGGMILIARKNKKWRQADLANRLDVTRQTVARMENGDPNIAIGTYFEGHGFLTFLLCQVWSYNKPRNRIY